MDSLRDYLKPVLQPLTRKLPQTIRDLGVFIVGEQCYARLVLDIDLTDTDCLKFVISKALGIGIVAASAIVKVPQIIKLVRSRSASGISFLSHLLETSSYLISLAYNVRNGFPFSTYGETALILGQNVIITVLVLKYGGRAGFAGFFVAALAGAVSLLFTDGILDMKTMGLLQAGAGTLGVASKIPQILAIWQDGGTGQLSAFMVFNYLLGSLARVFTTLQEVDDKLILYSFIAGFALNSVLALQMIHYWKLSSSSEGLSKVGGKASQPIAVSSSITAGTSTSIPPAKKAPTTRRRG